jgi:hypothetical protein
MSDNGATGDLVIRTAASQMNDVIAQISKAFEVSSTGVVGANERLLTITPRQPSTTLPRTSVLYFTANDTDAIAPIKLRSLFCNPVNV